MRHIAVGFGVLVMFVAVCLSAIVGMWIGDNNIPVSVHKVEVLTKSVQPGGLMRVEFEVVRSRACKVHIDRYVQDASGVRVPLADLDWAAGALGLGPETFISVVPVPRYFRHGRAVYQATSTYECNPWQRWFPLIVRGTTIMFEVEGPPMEPGESMPIVTVP